MLPQGKLQQELIPYGIHTEVVDRCDACRLQQVLACSDLCLFISKQNVPFSVDISVVS